MNHTQEVSHEPKDKAVVLKKMAKGEHRGKDRGRDISRESIRKRHQKVLESLKATAKEAPQRKWPVGELNRYRDQLVKRVTLKWEVITPREAAEMLDHNTKNRTPKLGLQSRLVRDMKDGNWHANGETIVFSKDGTLIDGQNRLMACLLADQPFVSIVVRGVDPESYKSIDTGVTRTPGDVLKMSSGVRNANHVSNALSILWRWENKTGNFWRDWEGNYPSRDEILEMYAKYPEVDEIVAGFRLGKVQGAGFPSGVLAAAKFLCAKRDPALADIFFDALVSGTGLKRTDPVYLIREKLLRARMSGAAYSQKQIMYLIIRAWNATRTGEEMIRLAFPKEGVFAIGIE